MILITVLIIACLIFVIMAWFVSQRRNYDDRVYFWAMSAIILFPLIVVTICGPPETVDDNSLSTTYLIVNGETKYFSESKNLILISDGKIVFQTQEK